MINKQNMLWYNIYTQQSLIWRKKNHPMLVPLFDHAGGILLHLTQRSGNGSKPFLICPRVQNINILFSFTPKLKYEGKKVKIIKLKNGIWTSCCGSVG